MTTQTEAIKMPARKPSPAKSAPGSASITAGIIGALGSAAVISWLGGLALDKGFGVSVPFMAGFFLVVAFLFLVKATALNIARAWHDTALEMAPRMAATTVAASAVAVREVEKLADAEAFLAMDKKIREGVN